MSNKKPKNQETFVEKSCKVDKPWVAKPKLRRIKLELSYDGTNYKGWQRQTNVPSIQETLETTLGKILGEPIIITGSGRTDAGVHALRQVAAFSTKSQLDVMVFYRALNGYLPHDIRILRVEEVPLRFHPIADAVAKRYRYLIDDNYPSFPLTRNYCWVYRKPLDLDTMRQAAQFLLGEHDFACFQTQGSPRKTTIRTISDVLVKRIQDSNGLYPPLICIEVEANGFLYNMMRTITGTLALLGVEGRRGHGKPERMKEIIASQNRSTAGATAPPHGLYLVNVVYRQTNENTSTDQ
ncbi:MAG: tRNA pseudouridine(38-40) synthase TruA [Planctomycetaceae bacterium]|jgi:tRNA pseudouridine38-40 synthase|nr:tRNA pseudouridine(38-40) synthase TruA [Planctomycetaceae bacterium]